MKLKLEVLLTPLDELPRHANIISSPFIYKIKVNYNRSLIIEARTSPHGKDDSLNNELTSDFSILSHVGVRIHPPAASLFRWHLSRLDVQAALLQMVQYDLEVYVTPPTEILNR